MTKTTDRIHERSVRLLEDLQKLEAERVANDRSIGPFQVNDIATRGANLIHSVAGSKSSYAENLRVALKQKNLHHQFLAVAGVLQAFHLDIVNGDLINIRQEIEAVVVSEILTQARKLNRTKGVHPAAVIIVACAGVEEFLRNWCDVKGISIPEKQGSIGRFSLELRQAGHIELPIERRIASWADYRNDAAHGSNWSKITPETANRTLREIEEFVVENRQIFG